MSVLSIGYLQALLHPHIGRLSRSTWPIDDLFEKIPDDLRLRMTANARASTLHSFMCSLARSEFATVEGIQIADDFNGSMNIVIDGSENGVEGCAVCRFKKLDSANHSRNLQTDRQKDMRKNLPLPGFPEEATYVDIGYTLNDQGKIGAVHAVRLLDEKLILSIPKDLSLPLPQPQELPGMGPLGGGRLFSLIKKEKDEKKSN